MAREYKDSGIEWIGQIPKEWGMVKYKFFASSRMGETILSEDTADEGVPIYSATQGSQIFGYIKNPKLILTAGDFVIPARGNSIGCVSIVTDDVATCTQTTICSCDIHNIYNIFLYYCSLGLKEYWFRYDGSAIPQITVNQVNNNIVICPPFSEQQKIADYLDKVCGEVDEMVALQETMIEELKAYKQSVITEAVTKGLDPNVPMRNSGIDWIGEIPEHWEQHQFRRIFEIKKIIAGTLGYDVLSVTQNGIKVKDLTKNEGQIAQDYSKYQLVDVDDYVMNHMDLLTGYVDCSKQNGVTSPDYRVFRAIDKSEISLAYYLKIFQTCYKEKIFYHLGQGVSGMGRWRLPAEQLKLFVLPMPPLSEQLQIASYLDAKCSEIDALITLKQAKIEELKEYKKSVIYEYVTGKKEVV